MKQNEIPTSSEGACSLAQLTISGIQQYGSALPLPADAETQLTAQLTAVAGAENEYLERVSALGMARARRDKAAAAMRVFAQGAMDVLRPFLGRSWTPAWRELGFLSGSIRLPNHDEGLVNLLELFRIHFVSHPEREVAAAGITAVQAAAIRAEGKSSLQLVRALEVGSGECRAKWTADLKALRHQLRLVRTVLETKFDAEDPRWQAFGFRRPADVRRPDIPTGLDLAIRNGVAFLKWKKSRRADRYRIYLKEGGSEVRLLLGTTEAFAALEGLTEGELRVSALNGAGESRLSSPILLGTVR